MIFYACNSNKHIHRQESSLIVEHVPSPAQMGGHLTKQVLVNKLQELVEEFYSPNTHLRMGQIMWPALYENETAAYGKTIEKTRSLLPK